MITSSETIAIGTITRTHGRQGELQCLMSNTCWEDADPEFLILRIDNILVPFRVTDWRGKGADSIIFQLAGIDNDEKALSLVGSEARMLKKDTCQAEDTEGDELLTWQDLIGCQVLAVDGTLLGTLAAIDESTLNTLGTTDNGCLVPLHEELILKLDIKNKILQLNIPANL